MANLILIPVILAFGYFLLVRPQQQRVRRQQELMASITVGDQVVTAGGIIATVSAIDDERAWLEIAPGTTVVFLRQAISRKLEPTAAQPGSELGGHHDEVTSLAPEEDDGEGEAQANAG